MSAGYVGVRRELKLEIGGKDAGERGGSVRGGQPLAQHVRVREEAAAKNPIGEHHGGSPDVFLDEGAALRGTHSQHIEKIGGDVRAFDLLGIAAVKHTRLHHPDARHVRKRAVATFDFSQHRAGERSARITGIAVACPDAHQPLRLVVRQRVQQNAMEDAEDGGVHANSQCQREQRNEGERGTPAEPAPGVARILEENQERGTHQSVADFFFDLLDSFELDAGGAARRGQGHAFGDEAIDRHGEARLDLFVQLGFHAAAM